MPFIQPFHGAPISSLFAEWQSFLWLWAALIVACFHGDGPRQAAIIPMISIAGSLLLAFAAMQMLVWPPEYLQQLLLPICYFVSLCAVVQLGYWLRQRHLVERCLAWLGFFLAFGAAYTVVAQFMQLLWPDFSHMPFLMARLPRHDLYGNIGQASHAATYLAIGWAAAHYLLSRGSLQLKAYLPFVFFLFAGIILTGQRSGFIYVVCLSILFWRFPMNGKAAPGSSRRSVWLCAIPFVYLLQGYLMRTALHWPVMDITSAARGLNSSWNAHLKLLQVGWSVFLEAPWFGVGWGRLGSYEFLRADILPVNHVHNIVLQLLAETGIFFTAALLSVIVLWLLRLLKFPASPEKLFVLGVVIVLSLDSLADSPLWYAYFLLPLGVFAGMFETKAVRLKFPSRLTEVLVKAMGLVAAGILFYAFFEAIYVTDLYGRRSTAIYSRSLHAAELKEIAQMPSRIFLEPYTDYIDSTGRVLGTDNLSENMALNQRLLNTSVNSVVITRQSIYQALAGNEAEAKVTFLRMQKTFPDQAPEMLDMVKLAASHANNENLAGFSKWVTEAALKK
ncbi:PglL family O-oligosaccharyltransferase [Collimonas fungivorans]|nr:O-antigen ligase family protein [Collimonas fungivorans]